MTFQVGIVATDGVILASDTLITQIEGKASYSTGEGQRIFSSSQKIVVHDAGRPLAYCWSGDELQIRIARDLIDSVRKENRALNIHEVRELLTKIANTALWSLYPGYPYQLPQGTQALPREQTGGSALIAYPGPSKVELWKLRVDLPTEAFIVQDKIAAGDTVNPAVFFLEKYYQPNTIENLLPLAAHTILMAAALNPSTIKGLELVVCSGSKFERLSPEKITKLVQFSQNLDRSISALLP